MLHILFDPLLTMGHCRHQSVRTAGQYSHAVDEVGDHWLILGLSTNLVPTYIAYIAYQVPTEHTHFFRNYLFE